MKGCAHGFDEPRVIRTWGRRRLRLLEPLLPFAERVDVYLKGRAQPSFYAVRLPGMTFVLGLSGWTAQRWTEAATFELLLPAVPVADDVLARAAARLAQAFVLSEDDLAQALQLPVDRAAAALARLCRQGRAVYDVERRAFRHRELFETPLDEAVVFPPDPRREAAIALRDAGEVLIRTVTARESRKLRKVRHPDSGEVTEREIVLRDWHVEGSAGPQENVEIVVNDRGRMIFGTCRCAFFKENLLNLGPCEHLLGLFLLHGVKGAMNPPVEGENE